MISDSSLLVLGTTRLFAERTPSARFEMHRDEHGFLRSSSQFFGFERLLDQPCSLVVAPPWIGKSFTARRIDGFLKTSQEGEGATQSGFHKLSNLEGRIAGQPLEPGWWNEWKQSQARATWIVDSLDEGQRRELSLCSALLWLVTELSEEQRNRLRLLIFAREGDLRELAPGFEGELREIFRDGFFGAELLSLDLDNARDVVEARGYGPKVWKQTLSLIERNHLQSVAGYPAALLFLAQQHGDAELSVRDVWEGILKQLLDEHHYRPRPFRTELDNRFAAAARIAAVLTVTGEEELADSAKTNQPTLSQIFPFPEPSYLLATREAGREALRSGMFRTSTEGQYRFLHKNVREWMAAFGMETLSLAKLRPMLQDVPESLEAPASIRPEFGDLAQLLGEVHDSSDIRAWFHEALGPFPSDLFTRTLREVRLVLDRLEELAARGGYLHWIDDAAAVQSLLVSGLGEELAERLKDIGRPSAARRMFLQIGVTLNLEEVLITAAAIVPDTSHDQGFRLWCAASIGRSERLDLLRSLESFIENAKLETRTEKEIFSTLLAAFVEKGVWTPARAFTFIPPGPASQVIDATRLLPYAFEGSMTVEEAKNIVSSLDRSGIENLNYLDEDHYRQGKLVRVPKWEVYASAVRKLATAEPAEPDQLRLLFPFVLTRQLQCWSPVRA